MIDTFLSAVEGGVLSRETHTLNMYVKLPTSHATPGGFTIPFTATLIFRVRRTYSARQSLWFLSHRQGTEAPGSVNVTAGHKAKLVPQVLVVPAEEQPFSFWAPALALRPLPTQPRPHRPEVRQHDRF